MEWAGAFGDLGTLIPFVVAYISVLGIDPHGMLFAFGAAASACGLIYRTPFPVQPMKAIGAVATTQAAQTLLITPNAVYAAGVVTGVPWLVLAMTGAVQKMCRLIGAPVVTGIVLGLGLGFMLQGMRIKRNVTYWKRKMGPGRQGASSIRSPFVPCCPLPIALALPLLIRRVSILYLFICSFVNISHR